MVTDSSSARVLVIDDFTVGRECLAAQLEPHYRDVRCAWSLPSLLEELDCGTPDLILLNFGTLASMDLLQVSLDLEPEPRVIAFGLSDDREVVQCAEAGAAGLHLRSETFAHLLGLMREVGSGRAHCSAAVSAILVGQVYATVSGRPLPDSMTEALTARETEILSLLEEGLTNQQIARRLSVTVHTVKNHVHNLLSKLGVQSRAEASKLSRAMKYASADGLGVSERAADA